MTETSGKLFVLEASGDGRLFSINPDGSDKTVIVTGCPVPDGVAVDAEMHVLLVRGLDADVLDRVQPVDQQRRIDELARPEFETRFGACRR